MLTSSYKPKLILGMSNKNRVARRNFCYLSMEKVNEIWKPVKGYEGLYEVSSHGRVRSLGRTVICRKGGERLFPPKEMVFNIAQGYLYLTLRDRDKNGRKHKVHRLVAEAFIPNPDNLPCINHKDEDKLNNNVDNLEWCTVKYNTNYGTSLQRGTEKRIEKYGRPVVKYTLDGVPLKEYRCMVEACNEGYSNARIIKCCNHKATSTRGVTFRYKGDKFDFYDNKRKDHLVYRYKKDLSSYDVISGIQKAARESGIPPSRLYYHLIRSGRYEYGNYIFTLERLE